VLGPVGLAVALLLGVVAGALIVAVFFLASTELPDGCETLGDLTRRITPTPLAEDDDEAEGRILDEVRLITASATGLSFDRVKPESSFVDDLRLD
ncbi:MAG: hypothetical protein AAGB93_12370, partial [Planctomycetota bacterium]